MDLGFNTDIYLTRVNWFTDDELTAQIENRAQTELSLFSFDVKTGKKSLLTRETSETLY